MGKNQKTSEAECLKKYISKDLYGRREVLSSTKTSSASERVYYLRGVSACDRKFCFALLRRRADT